MADAAVSSRSVNRLKHERDTVVVPAIISQAILIEALRNPRWGKEQRKEVQDAYRSLGSILKDSANVRIIASWFGDEAVVDTLVNLRMDIGKVLKDT